MPNYPKKPQPKYIMRADFELVEREARAELDRHTLGRLPSAMFRADEPRELGTDRTQERRGTAGRRRSA